MSPETPATAPEPVAPEQIASERTAPEKAATAPTSAAADGSAAPRVPDPAFAGRTYPPGAPRRISAERIADFAAATGADSPLHHDPQAARAAGYADVLAPPTFLVSLAQEAESAYISDPAAGIDFSRVVHGEEGFRLQRPVVAGDVLTPTLTVEAVRLVGGSAMITTRVDLVDAEGAEVGSVRSSLVVRGA